MCQHQNPDRSLSDVIATPLIEIYEKRTPINLPLQWYKNIYILIILSIIMDYFIIWALQQVKKTNNKTGNRLLQISDLIDWSPIRSHLDEMYNNKSEKGGRPNSDVILMFKILILQQWFGLSDLEVERQISDRFSFMEFLGYPEPFPDSIPYSSGLHPTK